MEKNQYDRIMERLDLIDKKIDNIRRDIRTKLRGLMYCIEDNNNFTAFREDLDIQDAEDGPQIPVDKTLGK